MNYIKNKKLLNGIIWLHKILGWLFIFFTGLSLVSLIFGFSFGSFLKIYDARYLGNLFIINQLITILIGLVIGALNLYVVKELKEKKKYAKYLSLVSLIFMVFLLPSPIIYIFSSVIFLCWLLYVNYNYAKYYIPMSIIIFSIYYTYISHVSENIKAFHHLAHFSSNYNILKKMLDDGVDPNMANENGMTALHYSDNMKKVELLLKYGANPNYENISKYTPIFKAGKNIPILLKYGADINHQNIDGNTPLQDAVIWGEYIDVQLLLENNAELTIKNKEGKTVKDLAIRAYRKEANENRKKIMDLILLETSH